jgi:hypothetical protein
MKQSITTYVQSCQVYQQAKSGHVKLPGLLQPLSMTNRAWEVVSLDCIEGLPRSNHHNVILVIIFISFL